MTGSLLQRFLDSTFFIIIIFFKIIFKLVNYYHLIKVVTTNKWIIAYNKFNTFKKAQSYTVSYLSYMYKDIRNLELKITR